MTHDPADDFDHPGVPEGHALRRHVLYRLARPDSGGSRRGRPERVWWTLESSLREWKGFVLEESPPD